MQKSVFKGQYAGSGKPIKNRALLVIDVQNEYFTGKLPVCYPTDTLPNVLQTIHAARESGIPIVMIQHTMPDPDAQAFAKGTPAWELHSSVRDIEADHYVEKNFPSSFVGTDLEAWLREHEIDTVVISGYMTQFCCDTTAKYAMHLGFSVEFLSDATATLGFENDAGKVSAEELHRAILVHQAARFSHVLSTETWIENIRPQVHA